MRAKMWEGVVQRFHQVLHQFSEFSDNWLDLPKHFRHVQLSFLQPHSYMQPQTPLVHTSPRALSSDLLYSNRFQSLLLPSSGMLWPSSLKSHRGWWVSFAGKGACRQAWGPESNLWDPTWQKPRTDSYKLSFAHHMHTVTCTCIHVCTHKQINR